MNNGIKVALRMAAPLVLTMALCMNEGLPVMAANASKTVPTFRLIQGEVTKIVSTGSTSENSTIILSQGRKQIEIKVNAATKYYLVAGGISAAAQTKSAKRKSNTLGLRAAGTAGDSVDEAAIMASCATDASSLSRFGKLAKFSDVQVGDRVIACIKTADNIAAQVLIIPSPGIKKVYGTITAVSNGSLTIAPTAGSPVTVNWDVNTKFTLKGLISVQSGQYVTVLYNRATMTATTVEVQTKTVALGAGQGN